MSLFSKNPLLLAYAQQEAAGGISRSLRFNSSDSAYLSRTPASAGNRKTWTWAGWVKRSALSSTQCVFTSAASSSVGFSFEFSSDNAVDLFDYSGGYLWRLKTTQVFRDPSAWQHIVLSFDSTQGTSANRVKFYANGVQVETFSTATYPSSSFDSYVNATNAHGLGSFGAGVSNFFSGYLADIYFIDGQALTPSSFTETDATTGQLIPKAFSGSYGSQGWHLEFADNSSNTATTLGKDTSGNGNNWTPNNLSVTAGAGNDSLVDVPTNGAQTDTGVGGEVRGNYATLNPLGVRLQGAPLSNGNLVFGRPTVSTTWGTAYSTIWPTSGKWYFESTLTAFASNFMVIGALQQEPGNAAEPGSTSASPGWSLSMGSTTSYFWNSATFTSTNALTFAANDVAMVALDLDNGKIWWGKNGTWHNSGSPSSGTNAQYTNIGTGIPTGFHVSNEQRGVTEQTVNFGQRPFAYTAPSGFKALCTANLPAPLVTKPNTVMDVKLYTGNGSTQTISGLGFSPDLVWIKTRSAVANHRWLDTIRGATKELYGNLTNAEGTDASGLTAFNSDGFSLGNSSGYNDNAVTHAAWCWDAGSSTVTNNTAGTITPTGVRANATAGFSIVTYTGTGANATVGHGLGVAPSFVIVKSRSNTTDWQGYHIALGQNYTIQLQSTSAAINVSNYWNGGVSSTTFGINGSYDGINFSGYTYVAYCFAPVVGYSSFGSYTGNGSADGPFVYTGFRPRWILMKDATTGNPNFDYWFVWDTARNPYNVAGTILYPNTADAEATSSNAYIDILSNGFKVRNSFLGINESSQTVIYAAFAESPFNYARAR